MNHLPKPRSNPTPAIELHCPKCGNKSWGVDTDKRVFYCPCGTRYKKEKK